MKKFLLAILFLPTSVAYSDQIVTGGLLLPTTGVVDTTGRSWADKYNENFRIIGSSLNITNSNINSIAVATGTIATNIANSTNTWATNIAASTAQYASIVSASTSAALLSKSNTNYIAVQNTLQSGASYFVTWATVTHLTVTDIAFPNGVQVSSPSPAAANTVIATPRIYEVVMGTLGALGNVDVASNNINGLNQSLILLNAAGLTVSATAYGTILLRSGVYTFNGATIPAGVTLKAENSFVFDDTAAVVIFTSTANDIFHNYGKIDGIVADVQGQKFGNRIFVTHTNSKTRAKVLHAQNASNAGVSSNGQIALATNANNFEWDIEADSYTGNTSLATNGQGSTFEVNGCNNGKIKIKAYDYTTNNTGAIIYGLVNSTGIVGYDSYMEGGDVLSNITSGGGGNGWMNSKFVMNKNPDTTWGWIVSKANPVTPALSTGTFYTNLQIALKVSATANIFGVGGDNAGTYYGITYEGIHVYCDAISPELPFTFVNLRNSSVIWGAILKNNTVDCIGTFETEGSGVSGTQKANMGNHFNRVLQ